MRMFSLIALVVVLAILAVVAKRQLQAAAPGPAQRAGSPRQIEQRMQQDVQRALQQGAAATASAAEQ